MFYGSFGTQNSMVTFIFEFDPRKGHLQVKLGQIRSNFKNYNLLTKICLCCAVLSQHSKNIIFYVRQIKMRKLHFKNVTSSPLPVFFSGHCTAKNKNIALKPCMHAVYMYLDHIYSVFLIT